MDFIKARLTDGSEIEFDSKRIGKGGEKVVFRTKNNQGVVCIYKHLKDRMERRRRLEKIVDAYNPTSNNKHKDFWKTHFCWPDKIIDGGLKLSNDFMQKNGIKSDTPLALVAPAYPSSFYYKSLAGKNVEKNAKWFTAEKCRKRVPLDELGNFMGYLQVCIKTARAVRKLHTSGLAHSDLSNNNVLIDPKNGNACIIDIDALVVPGVALPVVQGTPGYIAPEVLSKTALPSIATDKHALAVFLYEALLLRHPLKGPKVHSKSTDPNEDERLSMGSQALFVEHPTDNSNHLKLLPDIPLSCLGPHLKALFLKTFVEGLHDPMKRVGADKWELALYNTFDILHPSPEKGEWFVLAPGMPMICPITKQPLEKVVPYATLYRKDRKGTFISEGRTITIYHHFQIFPWHVFTNQRPDENRDTTRQGYFSFLKDNWWFTNESLDSMRGVDGVVIPPKKSVKIVRGLKLELSSHDKGRILIFDFMPP